MSKLIVSSLGEVASHVELINDGSYDVEVVRADRAVDLDLADAVRGEYDLEGLLGDLVLGVLHQGVLDGNPRHHRVHGLGGEAEGLGVGEPTNQGGRTPEATSELRLHVEPGGSIVLVVLVRARRHCRGVYAETVRRLGGALGPPRLPQLGRCNHNRAVHA